MERGTLAALAGLDTDLAPTELYRLAQAITQVRPDRVDDLRPRPATPGDLGTGPDVVFLDEAQAQRIGRRRPGGRCASTAAAEGRGSLEARPRGP